MKKTIWKRISESQLRKKNKFWSFVAKGIILICVGSCIIPRDWSEISLGDNFKKLNYRKGLNALWKKNVFDNVRSINLSSIIWCDYIPLFYRIILYYSVSLPYAIRESDKPSPKITVSINIGHRLCHIADYCIVNNTLEPSIEYIL